ncbi:replicase [Blueberry virus S]|uniref:ORF1 protein n=1 Tax=Blueberry virus S TaxID=2967988 RepID=A0AAE9N7K5_9VIRU|nr:replicase [Blueberry virus S]
MALTYRSPVEEVLTLFEPTAQSLIASTAIASFQKHEKDNFEWFRYSVPAYAKEQLSRSGIYLSPYAGFPHSHPVCKTLENYLLYVVVPSIVNSTFYFVGIKEFKINFLKSRFDKLNMISALNRYVSSADKIRYGNDFVIRAGIEHRALKRHKGLVDSPTLKALMPNVKTGAKLFLHDELHYWSKEELIAFLEICQPEVLLGTVVYPPELLIGSDTSLNPWCYEFEVKKKKLLFYPDGVRSEGYEQPISGGFLLQTSKIKLPNGEVYCVDLVCSRFAHHLFSITRGDLITPEHRSFAPFDAVHSGALTTVSRGRPNCFPVGQHTILRVYRYLRSLKKPDKQSAMAKFSQISHEPCGRAVKFMEELSDLIINTGSIRTVINPELLKSFFGNLGRCLPPCLAARLKDTRTVCLDEFISMLKPLSIDVKLDTVTMHTLTMVVTPWEQEVEEAVDIVKVMDTKWEGDKKFDRAEAPYIGLAPIVEYVEQWRIGFDMAKFLKQLGSLYLSACAMPGGWPSLTLQAYIRALACCKGYVGRAMLACVTPEDLKELAKTIRVQMPPVENFYQNRKFWFKSKAGHRSRTWYIEGAEHYNLVNAVAEVCTASARVGRRTYSLCPVLSSSAEDPFCMDCYYDPVPVVRSNTPVVQPSLARPIGLVAPLVKATTRQADEIPEGKSMALECTKSVAAALTCACGMTIPVQDAPHSSLKMEYYPDQLHNRGVAWYSKTDQEYKYNGGSHISRGWPKWLQLWMQANGVDIYYDCMLAQKYSADGKIGFHSDDEPIFAKGASIHTVNMDGNAEFGLECTAGQRFTPLVGNVQFTMPAGFQESHKHAVRKTTGGRVSFTFRKLAQLNTTTESAVKQPAEIRDEGFDSSIFGVSIRVEPLYENVDEAYRVLEVPGDGDCFWHAIGAFTGLSVECMKAGLKNFAGGPEGKARLLRQLEPQVWAEDESICAICAHQGIDIIVFNMRDNTRMVYTRSGNKKEALLRLQSNHFEPLEPREMCVVKAIAQAVKRKPMDVLAVALKKMGEDFREQICSGKGVMLEVFMALAEIFDVSACILQGTEQLMVNPEGRVKALFRMTNNHISYDGVPDKFKHNEVNVYKQDVALRVEDVVELRELSSLVEYKPSAARAKLLADCLHDGSTGVMCSELYNDKGHLYPEEKECAPITVGVLLGTFGCGKSRIFKEVLAKLSGKAVCYVSPRKALCDAFDDEIRNIRGQVGERGIKHYKSLTFEKALLLASKLHKGTLVIIDEIQLYPPGYLDLFLLLAGPAMRYFTLGDPCQSDYDSEKDRSILGHMKSDIFELLDGVEYKFNILSRRFQTSLFRGRLPCVMHEEDLEPGNSLKLVEGLDMVDTGAAYSKICLVSSFEEKKIVCAYFGEKTKCLTFGESTGMTFQVGCILLTGISAHTSEQRWVTALSRFRRDVVLVNAAGVSWEVLHSVYSNRWLGRFLSRSARTEDLMGMLPGKPLFTEGFKKSRLGADEGKREDKLVGDPWLKTMVDLLQIEDMEEVEVATEIMQDEWCKTHLPQCELESVRARWVHKFLAKEFREKRMGYLVSEQFTDQHSKQMGKHLTNSAERFEAIYPRHRAADTVTFVMAVRKRLSFSCPVKESAKLNQALPYGPFLLKEFLKRVPLKPMHDRCMMESAKFDFEEKKTSKSAATIENHSNRSCKDWLMDVGLVFSKSQLCTKFDNRFRDAKAAQTIVCFQHAVLCRFAPYMRYIEKKLNEVLPEKYYIHSGKGLEELNAWVIEGKFEGVCTESDYEAFDASQDHYIVAFEISLMRYLGLPHDLIEDYKFIKTHLGSKLGNFAIMRFSGEASTFLFNTMANMLFTFLQYDLKGNERICFAGDDMCANGKLHVSAKHKNFLSKLKLKAKVCNTVNPTFCGWNLSSDGIFKKPQLVLERLCIAKETNNLANCIDNYAIEVSYAYLMGERAKQRMSEEEVEAFYNCVRIIIKSKHLLKSDVADIYESAKVD